MGRRYHSVGILAFKENSERVPSKNLKILGSKILYEHVLDAAKSSNLDKIFIITNSKKIRNQITLEKDEKVEVFDCPDWYFGTKITGDKMISYPAEYIDADIYVQLFATAPFLRTETINESISVLENSDQYDSVFTVNKKNDWAWYKEQPITYFPGNLPRSQDAVPLMIETTGLYAVNKDALNEFKRRVGNYPYMLEVDEIEGLDIDTPLDFFMAEIIMSNMSKVSEFTGKNYSKN
ncbi:hypothetical protein HNV12_04025 [Methanococcoides sp. SA1]|nr:hypothetical protein [Methanococcoides sp. SA1]